MTTDKNSGYPALSKEYWDNRKAAWYLRGQRVSSFSEAAMRIITPLLAGCRSALDVGAGVGSLTLPLARELEAVTALEPAGAMLALLKVEVAAEGLGNVTFLESTWDEAEAQPHDLVISANIPGIYDESFLKRFDATARQCAVLIQSAGRYQDKFFYRELYPILFGREFPPRTDYLQTYTLLHSMGICADVSIIQYDFDQPFADLGEAVDFWKAYIPLSGDQHDAMLSEFLRQKLEPSDAGLIARFHKQSAVISWRKQ